MLFHGWGVKYRPEYTMVVFPIARLGLSAKGAPDFERHPNLTKVTR